MSIHNFAKMQGGGNSYRIADVRPFGRQRSGTCAVLLSALMACSAGSVCFAAATTAPSALYDLTTSDAGQFDDDSSRRSDRYSGAKAFDGNWTADASRWLTAVNQYSGWIVYKFNVPTVVDSIGIFLPSAGTLYEVERAPQNWTFEGSNDNSGWTVLDTQTGETSWTAGANRYYKFSNTEAYQYYKFNCTTNNGETQLQVGELEFYCTGTGDCTWTGGGKTSLVNDDANWGGAMPGSENTASINNTGATPATIPAGLTVYKSMYLANGNGSSAKVEQTTGTVILRSGATFGRAGGSAEYAISGGKLVLDNILYMSARSGKSSSILDISGDGEVVLSGALYMCTSSASAGSTARINISENGKLSAAGAVRLGTIGSCSTGTVHQAGGTFSVASTLSVGFSGNDYGEYKMSGGTCSTSGSSGNIMIGFYGSSQGLFEMTGGTLYCSKNLYIGREGYGTFVASGDETVATATDGVTVGLTSSSSGTLIVTNGAKIVTKQICAGAGASYVVFDGAVLTATASSTSSVKFLQDLCDITLGSGGLTINTEGYDITIANCTFNVTPGAKITVTGSGTVTFADTTVNLTETPARAFTFAETDGAFSGLPTLSGAGKMKILGNSSRIVIGPPGLIFILR